MLCAVQPEQGGADAGRGWHAPAPSSAATRVDTGYPDYSRSAQCARELARLSLLERRAGRHLGDQAPAAFAPITRHLPQPMPIPRIHSITPRCTITGGRIAIHGPDFAIGARLPEVRVGSDVARVVFASRTELGAVVITSESGELPVRVEGVEVGSVICVGAPVATGLHQVEIRCSTGRGNLYVTYSGTRGQQVPVSIFRVTPNGARESFSSSVTNPTSMAVAPDGTLYVSSRFEGAVYRLAADGSVEVHASDLGIACGLAFAPDGTLYVGDSVGHCLRSLARRAGARICHTAVECRRVSSRARQRWSLRDGANVVSSRCDLPREFLWRGLGASHRLRPAARHRLFERWHPARRRGPRRHKRALSRGLRHRARTGGLGPEAGRPGLRARRRPRAVFERHGVSPASALFARSRRAQSARPMSQLLQRKPIAALVSEIDGQGGLKRVLGAGDLIMLAIGR